MFRHLPVVSPADFYKSYDIRIRARQQSNWVKSLKELFLKFNIMKTLFQAIESGTISPLHGLIIAAIAVGVLLAIAHFLPEHKTVKR